MLNNFLGNGPSFFSLCVGIQTRPALAGKGELTAGDCAADGTFCFRAEGLGSAEFMQVDNSVAAFTNEMNMRCGVGIEPLNAVDSCNTAYQTLLLKEF